MAVVSSITVSRIETPATSSDAGTAAQREATGIALAAVVIGSNANLRTEMRSDLRSLETRLSAVEQRQAKTEGLLEGLRDAIAAQGYGNPPGENDAT